MAGGIDWFRWHHGSVTDPKFQLVARKAGARLGDVITVWAFILEKASADSDRGTIGELDFETIDFLLDADEGTAIRILDAMSARGLIIGSRIAKWEERQPKREREDDTAADRKRRQREREKSGQAEPDSATDDSVTPRHATSHQETPRGEERRVEVNPTTPNGVVVGNAVAGQGALPVETEQPASVVTRCKAPACPHQEIIAVYHELLPIGSQVRSWTGTRERHLQARWREDVRRQSLDWWRRFFGYVAKSEFLTGKTAPAQGRTVFVVSLGWLVEPEHFARVIEGYYHREAA